jgi:hypothetical protein
MALLERGTEDEMMVRRVQDLKVVGEEASYRLVGVSL